MDFPDLEKLPPWAALIFVVCIALIFVATRTGWLQGLKSTPAERQAEVAAVIVDPKALNDAAAQVAALAAVLSAIRVLLEQYLATVTAERDQAEKDQWLREELIKLGIVPGEKRRAPRRRPARRPP